jgi:hypothetical protein
MLRSSRRHCSRQHVVLAFQAEFDLAKLYFAFDSALERHRGGKVSLADTVFSCLELLLLTTNRTFFFLGILGGIGYGLDSLGDRIHSLFPPALAVNILGHVDICVTQNVPHNLRACAFA